MATNPEKPDFKKQLRAMVQGSQSLTVAYIGVVNDLFAALKRLGTGDVAAIATATRMDAGYVRRWCDAAFAFGYLNAEGELFRLSEMGAAMSPDAPNTLMPLPMTMVSSVHTALRSASLMRSGERPGETVMAQVETLLPWFGAMLEGTFARFFEEKICPGVPIFAEINERGGLVVDLAAAMAGICALSPVAAGRSEGSVSTLSKKTWHKRRALLKKRALATGSISSGATRESSSSISLPISLP
jgi:hypothetical protein